MATKISLCMVVRNAENTLPPIFDYLGDFVDEKVIFDQDSDDKTKEVCSDYGCYYFKVTRKNLADIDRQTCYNIATGDMVLALDDDEMPDKRMVTFLRDVKQKGPEYDVYWFRFKNKVDGVDIYSVLGDDWHPRFWTRSDSKPPAIVWPKMAHTYPTINSKKVLFSDRGFVVHKRSFDRILKVHNDRIKAIDVGNQRIEQEFIRRVNQLLVSRGRKSKI